MNHSQMTPECLPKVVTIVLCCCTAQVFIVKRTTVQHTMNDSSQPQHVICRAA